MNEWLIKYGGKECLVRFYTLSDAFDHLRHMASHHGYASLWENGKELAHAHPCGNRVIVQVRG